MEHSVGVSLTSVPSTCCCPAEPPPPPGFRALTDDAGALLMDDAGNLLIEEI
ncbi:hypothetical protein ACI7BZ_19990 [Xanthobacter sp. AM11]|uniref:hypothetical protein n=1 Tax=Xanthobacter sp. AM11 TaxID=3380643 RepID=UPI0039BF074E